MNAFSQIWSAKYPRALRAPLIALLVLLPAFAQAQTPDVPVTVDGITVPQIAVPAVYNGKYVLQLSTWGFFWLDTETMQAGHVQAISLCVANFPPSQSGFYLGGGDCNSFSQIVTSGNIVVPYTHNGLCWAKIRGCGGPRDDGHMLVSFGLGNGFPYLGDLEDIPPSSTQMNDPQGRRWTVLIADTTYRNFYFHVISGGGATATPSASPTPAPPTPTPTPGPAVRATNMSGQTRTDGANYYGDLWQFQDISNPSSTRTDWDFNYLGSFLSDEGGDPATEGTVTGYFPCDPSGQVQGVIRTGVGCMGSLGLQNPPNPGNYQFAMLSNVSPNPIVSSVLAVSCPQALILGYTGFSGTCAKSGGVLTIPTTGGIADARGSKGNTSEAQFDWTFPGSQTPNVSGQAPGVPDDATTFTLTITFPGGYQATASGSITRVTSVPRLGIYTDAGLTQPPFVQNGAFQLTAGTTYYLKDIEDVPPASADFFLHNANGDTSIGHTTGPGPLPWTPLTPCSSGCSAKVTVGALSDSKPVVISPSGGPTPAPTPVPTATPPPTGGNLSVFVTGPTSGARNAALAFTANANGGTGNFSYSWACDFNPFSPLFSAGSQTRTCTYSVAGTYNVKVRVSDGVSTAQSADYLVSITGGLPAPKGDFSVTGATLNQFNGRFEAPTGTPITFTATEVESNVTSYSWSFGGTSTGSGRSVTHTFSSAGGYPVSLTVAGNETTTSGTSSSTKNFTISGLPAPSAAFTVTGATPTGGGSYDAEAGALITFTATGANISGYAWDFGDGTSATTNPATKRYATTGARTVSLTVTGDGTVTGGSRSGTASLNVIPTKFKAIIVPGAAHLDLGASVWGTDVTVTNPGTDTLTITPNFYPYLDGMPDNVDLSQIPYDSTLSFQLAPGASWSQVDVVRVLNGGSNKGTLILKYEGSADPVVTARVYFASAADPQGASYGAAFPSFKITGSGGVSPQSAQEELATDQTIIGLRSDNGYRFVVTLYNASGSRATFRLNATDEGGVPVQIKDATGSPVSNRDFSIGPYQQIQVSDSNIVFVPGDYVFKASRVSAAGALIAFGTALDRKSSDLVQISDDTPPTVGDAGGNISYYVAGVSHLDTARAQWRTDLRIFNRSSLARNLSFEYVFTKSNATEKRALLVNGKRIGPGELLTFDDVVDSLLKPGDPTADLSGDTAGVLRIFYAEDAESASKPLIIGLRNYDDPSDGTGTAGTQLGVYSASQSTTVSSPALVTPGAEESSRFYSQIGLFALDNVLTTGRISAYDKAGHEVGHFDFALNNTDAGGAGHFGQVRLSNLTDFTNPGTPVSVRVSVTSGGRLGTYVTMVDLKTNDLTFIQGRPLP